MFTSITVNGVSMEFAFTIQLDLPNAARDRKAVEELLPQLAVTALEVRHVKREQVRRQLVELLVGDVHPTAVDMTSARLEAQAYRHILTGSMGAKRWETEVVLTYVLANVVPLVMWGLKEAML